MSRIRSILRSRRSQLNNEPTGRSSRTSLQEAFLNKQVTQLNNLITRHLFDLATQAQRSLRAPSNAPWRKRVSASNTRENEETEDQ